MAHRAGGINPVMRSSFPNYAFSETDQVRWSDALQKMKELCIANDIKPHQFMEIFEAGLCELLNQPKSQTNQNGRKRR